MLSKKHRVRLAMAAVVLAGLTTGLTELSASAATGPKIVVTPDTNLRNGESVTVKGDGFKPGDDVYIVECLRGAKGSGQCYVSTTPFPMPVTITATGLLPATKFKVRTGKIGSGTCGTTAANLAKCDVSVGNAAGTDSTSTPIVFKKK